MWMCRKQANFVPNYCCHRSSSSSWSDSIHVYCVCLPKEEKEQEKIHHHQWKYAPMSVFRLKAKHVILVAFCAKEKKPLEMVLEAEIHKLTVFRLSKVVEMLFKTLIWTSMLHNYAGKHQIGDIESLQFDLATIKAATDNFSDANKLGQGGFGAVYKVLCFSRSFSCCMDRNVIELRISIENRYRYQNECRRILHFRTCIWISHSDHNILLWYITKLLVCLVFNTKSCF